MKKSVGTRVLITGQTLCGILFFCQILQFAVVCGLLDLVRCGGTPKSNKSMLGCVLGPLGSLQGYFMLFDKCYALC